MTRPVLHQVLVVAGLDPTAGAGLLADAAVLAAYDVRALGVITASTEQDTAGVRAVHALPAALVGAQVAAVLADAQPQAVKLGMLGSGAIAWEVASALARTRAPVVWDPVLRPTRGGVALYPSDALEAFAMLAPRAHVITPNADELAALSGMAVVDEASQRAAAHRLVALGARAVLAKGGHVLGGDAAVDWLVGDDGTELRLASPRVLGPPTHGTGCVLSSALAASLACGASLADAARAAKAFVSARLAAPLVSGRGAHTLV